MVASTTESISTIKPEGDEKPKVEKNSLYSIGSIFEGLDIEESQELMAVIYSNYERAISMRGREPLEEQRFQHHFFENDEERVAFGSRKDGLLLGNEMDGVFIPTHFAPTSLMGGGRLMRDLVNSDIPSALFLTEDLVVSLRKMKGWKVLPVHINVPFRDQVVEKTLVINKWDVIPKLALGQAERFIESTVTKVKYQIRNAKYYMGEFGQKVKDLINKDNANSQLIEVGLGDLEEDNLLSESV